MSANCREYLGLEGWCPQTRAKGSEFCEQHYWDRIDWQARTYPKASEAAKAARELLAKGLG